MEIEARTPRYRKGAFHLVQTMTLARLPLAAAFAAILLGFGRTPSILIVCGVLLVLNELTDLLDGILARKLGVVSEWGATLDPFSDSVSRLTIYWAMAYRGLAMALVPLVMACRDVTVAYCRIILTRSGRSVAAKRSGKIKGQVQSIGAVLLLAGPFYWPYTGEWTLKALSGIVSVVTALSLVEYAAAAFSASKAARKEAE